MNTINQYIIKLRNKIDLKLRELNYEKDIHRRQRLQKELQALKLKKEIAEIRKKIKQLEQ